MTVIFRLTHMYIFVSLQRQKALRELSGLCRRHRGEESACNAEAARDIVSIPGLGKFPGGGHGNPFQHCCLENPMDRGPWRATVHGVTKSRTRLKHLPAAAGAIENSPDNILFHIQNGKHPKAYHMVLHISLYCNFILVSKKYY